MSTANRLLLRGSFFRNAELLVGLAAAFVVTPFLVRALGVRMFGFWTLIGAFVGYYGLMDFGLSSAAARFLAQALGKDDRTELRSTADTAAFLFCLIGGGVLAAAVACALACPLFVDDPAEAALIRRIVLLTGAATAIGFPLRVYTGLLTAHLRYDVLAGLAIVRALFSNLVILACLERGGGLMGVAAITVAASLLQNAATWAACRRLFPAIRIAPLRFDRARVRAMFGYSWKTFACQFGDVLRYRLDSAVIAGFLSVSLLTPFSIGVRLVEGFIYLVHNSVGMMIPVFSRYEGEGDYGAMRDALLKSTRASALLSAFVGSSVIFYGPAFILRWMGPGFESSGVTAAILCAGLILELSQTPGVQLLYGLSKHQYYAAMTACEGILNLFLSIVFLRRFGMYGVALGTAVSMTAFKLLVQPVYIARVIGVPLRTYLGEMILVTLVKSAAPLGLYFLLIRDLVLPDFVRLALCLAGQTLLFAPAAYFFILGESERRALRGALRVDGPAERAVGPEEEAT